MEDLAYRPLQGRQEIRLLGIYGAHRNQEQIRCDLEHVALDEQHPMHYAALSYCWGDPDDTVNIIVNGVVIPVTRSLEGALKELRRRNYDQVWVDAICINQRDANERIAQIHLMPQIYSVAGSVIAWLGSDADFHHGRISHRPDRARRFIASFMEAEDPPHQRRQGGNSSVDTIRLTRDRESLRRLLRRTNQGEWRAFRRMLECAYWNRVWIIQEISLAHRLRLLWSRAAFDFRDVVVAILACQSERDHIHEANLVAEMAVCSHIVNLFRFRKRVRDMQPISLMECLLLARRSITTVPRDRVFALLGLAFDRYVILRAPSYTIPRDVLNTDLTLRLIHSTKSMDVMVFRTEKPGRWFRNWFSGRPLRDDRIADYLACRLSLAEQPKSRDIALLYKRPKTMLGSWSATAGTSARGMYEPDLNGNLRVRARIVDWIGTCSATFDERGPSPAPSYDDFFRPRRAARSRTTKNILFYLLHDLTCPTQRQKPGDRRELFRLLSTQRRQENVERSVGDLVDWLSCATNQNFHINGLTLWEWLSEPSAAQDWLEAQVGGYTNHHIRVARRILATLRLGMRLCVTHDQGMVGWVTKYARRGDAIALLAGCSVPVVLREVRNRTGIVYQVVGDGIIYGLMNGEGAGGRPIDRWQQIRLC